MLSTGKFIVIGALLVTGLVALFGSLENELGFSHAIEAATIDASESPVSVIYLER